MNYSPQFKDVRCSTFHAMNHSIILTTLIGASMIQLTPLFAQESVDELVKKLKGQAGTPNKVANSSQAQSSNGNDGQASGVPGGVPAVALSPQDGDPKPKVKGFTTRGLQTQSVTNPAQIKTRSVRFTSRGIPSNIEVANRLGAVKVAPVVIAPVLSSTLPRAPLPQEQTYEIRYQVDPVSQVTRRTILFQVDSTEFANESSMVEIAKLAQAFKNPELMDYTFVIEGHSSSEGVDQHNLELSNQRAAAIVKSLVGMGVAPEKLIPVGFGETDSNHPDTAPEVLRAQDRRVEIFRLER